MTESGKLEIREKINNGTIYTCKEYVEWRQKVFERDRFVCQLSNEPGGHLEAHHIKSKWKYPELIYDVNNGITLRKYMHKFVHEKGAEKFEKRFTELAKSNKAKKRIKKVVKKMKSIKGIKKKKSSLRSIK